MIRTSDDVYIEASPRDVQEAILHLHEEHSWWPQAKARGGFAWVEVKAETGKQGESVYFKARVDNVRQWEGFRWVFEAGCSGSSEFWLEPYRRGTIVHYLAEIAASHSQARAHRWALRRALNGLKDFLEVRIA